ncbi:uncharacterized protein A1O9_11297 [Exophiala aquamarina CBS 119918]|uniref:Zn(2)-C6 fungal-type domain-containing protein n=1 Tax=Exophiala aquamarina CBS 119918 TaxID=1182545 RepID=A0A072NYE2_9EURO|nr:uncharacterized protein A1O9_11297 [Exophiala aquamarina CBS 119918]KEF52879.1 hypothetical protein A1O9_11297 [Exophiala aquamarina CBS 119918]
MSSESQNLVGPMHLRPPRVAPGRSCIACRRRKIKCDREQPCAYCVKIRVQCVYPASEKESKRPADDDVSARLKRIEKSLARLEASFLSESSPRPREESQDAATKETPNQEVNNTQSTPGGSGRLVVEEGDTRYVSGSFWAELEDEGEGEYHDLAPNTGAAADVTSASPSDPTTLTGLPSYQRFIFGMTTTPEASGLQHLHPPEARIFTLWQIYLENVDPLLKLLHAPTVQRQLLRASTHLDKIPPPVEALMFAIYFAAVTSLQSSDATRGLLQQERPDLLNRYRAGIEQSLANANFMTTPDVATLQALTLYLICARQTVDKAYIWSMVGLLYRLATKLGLHRDPVSLGLPPFMAEMRRRLWWQICILDVRIAEDNDMDPLICEHNFDTQYPSNANDGDLDMNMTEPREATNGRTEMLFCLTRFEISYAARKLVFSEKFSSDNGYPSMNLAEKTDLIDNVVNDLQEKYLKDCDLEIPICFLAVTASRLVLAKMKLTIYHPARTQSSSLSHEQFIALVASSIDIIEYAHQLRTDPKYSRWIWLFQQYVEWDAVAFLLSSLTVSPLPSFATRAWKAIDGFLEDWKSHVPHGQRERRWRRLLALQAKARAKQGATPERDVQPNKQIPISLGTSKEIPANAIQQTNAMIQIPSQVFSEAAGPLQGWPLHQSLALPPSQFSQADNNQQAARLNMTYYPSIISNSATQGCFDDWGFDNTPYPMYAAASWEVSVDEDWGAPWL